MIMEIIIYDKVQFHKKIISGLKTVLWMIISVAIWIPLTFLFVWVCEAIRFIDISFAWGPGGSSKGIHLLAFSPLICAGFTFFLIFKIRVLVLEKGTRDTTVNTILINMCVVWRNIGIIFFLIVIVSGLGMFLLIFPVELFLTIGLIVTSFILPKHIKNEKTRFMKTISLRPFTDSDIPIFTKWLQKPYIKKWYDPIDEWLEEVQNRDDEFAWLHHFIVVCDNTPIGFCQYYDCYDSREYEDWNGRVFDVPDEVYTIDYLIGDENYLGKGYGKELIRILSEFIFLLGAEEIIVDPDKKNTQSNGVLLANDFFYNEIYDFYQKFANSM
jgi:RimJ/RimL family protein N-acetyltransferase